MAARAAGAGHWHIITRHLLPGCYSHIIVISTLAIPGMIGEAIVLSNLSTFMPKLRAESGGRYGAFLFITYGLVLGLAEAMTIRAKP